METTMMPYEHPPWPEGWEDRIRTAVHHLGYQSLLELMQAHSGKPYGQILRLLRSNTESNIPMMQLQKLHMFEASAANGARCAAMDSLVRTLREHIPRGWNKSKDADRKRAWARAYWVLPARTPADRSKFAELANSVWDNLKAIQPPDDWCPSTSDDPIVREAFARGWPE
jgi:hypothetical protein